MRTLPSLHEELDLRQLARRLFLGAAALLGAFAAFPSSIQAATFIWKGGAGSNGWTLNGNWTTTAPANDGTADLIFTDAFFSGTDFVFPNLNVNYSVDSLTFNGGKSFDLKTDAARTLTIGAGGLTQNSAAGQLIEHAVSLGSAQTWTFANGAGALTVGGGVANGGNLLTVTSFAGSNTLNGAISGTGGLTKNGLGNLNLGGASTFTGVTNITGGTLTLPAGGSLLNTNAQVGPGATLTISGGSLDAGTAAYFTVGNVASASAATANLSAGSLSTGESDVGAVTGSVATFNHSGGTHTANPGLLLGVNASSSGTYNLSGTGVLNSFLTEVGRNGTGTFTQSGGTHTVSASLNLATTGAASVGTYNLQGGQLTTSSSFIGSVGSGTFVQTGGTHSPSNFVFGNTASGTGQYTLSGGTLQTSTISRGPGAGTFLFDGGTLQANAATTNFMTGLTSAKVQTGGAKIDSSTFAITVAQSLLHDSALGATRDGGLVKSGTSTLTLTGASTFTGPTNVNAGTLTLGTGGSLTNTLVSVAPGATLTINGGSVDAGAAAYFNIANTAGAATATVNLLAGSLTVGEDDFGVFTGTNAAFVHSGGTHTATAGLGLGVVAGSTATYTLSGASSTLSAPTLSVGTGGAGTFTQSNGTVTSSTSLTIGTSVGGSGTYNLQGGQLSTANVLVGERSAGVFNQTAGTLTVGSSSALYLGVNSGSTGTVNLSGGTLQTPAITGGAGASTFNFNGGTLQATAASATFMSGLTTDRVQAGGAKINSNGFAITIAQPLVHDSALGTTRDGGLTKSGVGTLTLIAPNTYTGNTSVNGGTLTIATGSSITNSFIEANAGGTITINGGMVDTGAAAFFQIGNNAGTATGNLLAGSVTSVESDLGNVASSVANFTHSGGTHTVGGGLYLAVGTSSTATYTLSGASSIVSSNGTNVGWRGTGTFTQNAGTHTAGVVSLGNFAGSNGTYRLNGGTLKAHQITRSNGAGTFYFDGGTVELTATDSAFLTSAVTNYLGVGGAKIDTHGFDATISRPLLHDPALGATADGGVTKGGIGTLTLNTNQTLQSLTINGGAVTVTTGATLDPGTATAITATGALNINSGGTLTGASDFTGTGAINIAGAYLPGTPSGPDRTTSASFAQNMVFQGTTGITMELAGLVAGTDYDQLVFNGPGTPHVTWNGTLNVNLILGFTPQAGNAFDLFNFDPTRAAGAFTSINLPVLPVGLFWRAEQLYVDGTLKVSSVPGSYAEWQAAFGAGAFEADGDGDGVPNGIEFLLGTNPTRASGSSLQEVKPAQGANTVAAVTLDIPSTPANDAHYRLRASSDLVTWTLVASKDGSGPWTGSASVTSAAAVGGFTRVTIAETLPPGTARRFHRLEGEAP